MIRFEQDGVNEIVIFQVECESDLVRFDGASPNHGTRASERFAHVTIVDISQQVLDVITWSRQLRILTLKVDLSGLFLQPHQVWSLE